MCKIFVLLVFVALLFKGLFNFLFERKTGREKKTRSWVGIELGKDLRGV